VTILRNFDRLSMAHGIESAHAVPRLGTGDLHSRPAGADQLCWRRFQTDRMPCHDRPHAGIDPGRQAHGRLNSPMPERLNGPLSGWTASLLTKPVAAFAELVDEAALEKAVLASGCWLACKAEDQRCDASCPSPDFDEQFCLFDDKLGVVSCRNFPDRRCGNGRSSSPIVISLAQSAICSRKATMLVVSYAVAALVMGCAAFYFYVRLRLFLTATTMLLGSLLLIYGPAYLSFMLSSGEKAMVIYHLSGSTGGKSPIFSIIHAASADFPAILIAMNFAMALMFIGVIAGIEIVNRLIPNRIATTQAALAGWNSQPLEDNIGGSRVLLLTIAGLTLFLAWVSISENHIGTIKAFLSIPDEAGRVTYRLNHGSSPNYLYRLALGTAAPMLAVWGLLSGWVNRSWMLVLAAGLLFVAVMIGKSDTLSKAPPAFFLIQLIVAGVLVFGNRMSWRSGLVVLSAVILVLYLIIKLTIASFGDFGVLGFLYYRVFEVPSEAVLETFGAFPFRYPHTWGANIRPLAAIMGLNYVPSFTIISQLWHNTKDATSNALFIADAWIDFSYAGVFVFSMVAGATCRLIDAAYLVKGKTAVGIAVMSAALAGVFALLVSSLNTAFLSGGLLLAPLLAGALFVAIRLLNQTRAMPVLND
jgi:hypothetical protein